MYIKKINKKAVIEIQFNWLYVAIVGFVILLVFISIANGIRKSAQQQLEYELTKYFDNILVGVQGIENSEHNITLSGLDLKFDVSKTGKEQCNYYTLGKTGIKQDIKYVPIFSSELIKTTLLTNTLDWNAPFRASFFVYVTSPANIFVFDDEKIKNNLPSNSKKKDLTSFKSGNYNFIKYVLLNKDPETINLPDSVSKLKDSQVSAVKINSLDFGNIDFYEKKGKKFVKKGSSKYYDKETLLAAIYSDNIDSYECNLKKAVLRLNKITKTLIERSLMLYNADILQNCEKQDYIKASDLFKKLEAITEDGIIQEQDFVSVKDELKKLNDKLNRMSCPTIY